MNIYEADKILAWASEQNPGPWIEHSRNVSKAAMKIAEYCKLDVDRAGVYGMLHDVGRYKGPSAMMHIYDGYEYCVNKGEIDLSQICITHSFPIPEFDYYSGANDCSEEVENKIKKILKDCKYSDYDLLIILCDSLALPEGICLLEKRLVDVAMRHGIKENTLDKWKEIYRIKHYFEQKMGRSIYSLFPEAKEVTFTV